MKARLLVLLVASPINTIPKQQLCQHKAWSGGFVEPPAPWSKGSPSDIAAFSWEVLCFLRTQRSTCDWGMLSRVCYSRTFSPVLSNRIQRSRNPSPSWNKWTSGTILMAFQMEYWGNYNRIPMMTNACILDPHLKKIHQGLIQLYLFWNLLSCVAKSHKECLFRSWISKF